MRVVLMAANDGNGVSMEKAAALARRWGLRISPEELARVWELLGLTEEEIKIEEDNP